MKLSVVIVNFNVCAPLKKALNALIAAGKNIDYELLIVDNASTDGSVKMLNNDFPCLRLIQNQVNEGYAKAANKALNLAKGEYVFLVSADTICSKKSLEKTIDFIDHHPLIGGLSIRMITPRGNFITESKRGLTKPWIAFFKVSGLTKVFQKSRIGDRHPADWTQEFETSEIDVLNGNCMLLRRSVINDIGLFDERFKEYGHNIDMSYRIKLAGYKNYYFAKTHIIYFDSQPVSKLSLAYVRNFYGAMFIFAGKYLFKLPEIKVESLSGLFPTTYEVD